MSISILDIQQARQRIAPYVVHTDLTAMALPGGGELTIKMENLQATGAFKVRGAANCLLQLSDEQKKIACRLSEAAGADFVKTSTGFSTGGATEADIRLMRETVGPDMGVKASGGIRTREDAEKMLAAGASRIGASATAAIIGA